VGWSVARRLRRAVGGDLARIRTGHAGIRQTLGRSDRRPGNKKPFRDSSSAHLAHQDPRYFRMGAGRHFSHRLAYALSRVVVTRKDDGTNTFNSSLVLSTVLAKSLSNAYYPQQERGFSHTMNRVEGSLLGNAQGYVLREFVPDIVGVCRKHQLNGSSGWNEDCHFPEGSILTPFRNWYRLQQEFRD